MTDSNLYAGIAPLTGLSEDELELELGRRLAQVRDEVNREQLPTAVYPTGPTVDRSSLQALPLGVRNTAQSFLRHFNRQMRSLVCDEKDPDHAKLAKAADEGIDKLALLLTGMLVASLGWLPGLATVIAVLLAKRILSSGLATLCESWNP
jgi:hypothetical protein